MSEVLRFDLSKDPKGNPITYGRVGDSGGISRKVKIFEDGEPFDLTGWTITFEGNTSKYKTNVFDSDGISSIDEKKGEFNYTFPNMAFAVEGQYERAYFSFIKGDLRKSTGNFEIIIFDNSDINAPEAETIITEYNKLVDELQKLQKQNISDLQKQQNSYIQSSDDEFKAIQARMTELETQINNYEKAVGQMTSDAVNAVDEALNEFKAGAFYTQIESDDRFAKKIDLNKNNVGLGSVDNFATATQAEAEAGLAKDKFVTPFLVFKAIAKWVQGKFVTPEDLLNKTYPIGAVFFSVNSTSPSLLLGGTWERFAKGQVLVGVDESDADFAAGKTGGEKSHKLSIEEMPNHAHRQLFSSGATGIGGVGRSPNSNKLENITEASAITSTGGDQAHNNLQPFTTVYIWKRIA